MIKPLDLLQLRAKPEEPHTKKGWHVHLRVVDLVELFESVESVKSYLNHRPPERVEPPPHCHCCNASVTVEYYGCTSRAKRLLIRLGRFDTLLTTLCGHIWTVNTLPLAFKSFLSENFCKNCALSNLPTGSSLSEQHPDRTISRASSYTHSS